VSARDGALIALASLTILACTAIAILWPPRELAGFGYLPSLWPSF